MFRVAFLILRLRFIGEAIEFQLSDLRPQLYFLYHYMCIFNEVVSLNEITVAVKNFTVIQGVVTIAI